MPKRACPFTETFSSQYKIHIGRQELSKFGVFGGEYRQEIYEKTKNLLFNGAKAVLGKIWTGEEGSVEPRPADQAEAPAGHALLKGQTLIGQDGRLMRTSQAPGAAAAAAPASCCVCQRSPGSKTTCSQCERPACSSCTRECSSCSSPCCSVCSITDYSGRYDEVLCCSCST